MSAQTFDRLCNNKFFKKVNMSNHINNLCPSFYRDGSGICFNLNCTHFHPTRFCRNKPCRRDVCAFLHNDNYYGKLYCNSCFEDKN